MKKVLIISLLSMVAWAAIAASPHRTVRDIPYTSKEDAYSQERLKLDIHYPLDQKNCKVVIWFHGGGLTGGNKEIPPALTDKGIVVVGVAYRLLPSITIDACIDDAAEAVAWVFKNIQRYGGNPASIYVSGHSAGGYLTMMLGLDKSWLARYGIDSDSIAALIPFSGQAISHFAYRHMNDIPNLQPTIDRFAPLYHVRPDAPPMVLITGDRELELFGRYEENAYLWRMMKLTGHKSTVLHELGGFDHVSMAAPAFNLLLDTVSSFGLE